MQKLDHIIQYTGETCSALLTGFLGKCLGAVGILLLQFSFGTIGFSIVAAVILLIIIDTITGDIELSQPNESLFLHFKNTDGVGNYLKIKTSDDGGISSQYKYEDYENNVSANSIQLDNFANNATIRLDNSSIMLANGNQITIDPASVKGIECNADFSANITDLDYTQKIYVDTHIAFIPIPTSSTDPGIKGQMAVDATYLYICVDTDTWTRVALAW